MRGTGGHTRFMGGMGMAMVTGAVARLLGGFMPFGGPGFAQIERFRKGDESRGKHYSTSRVTTGWKTYRVAGPRSQEAARRRGQIARAYRAGAWIKRENGLV